MKKLISLLAFLVFANTALAQGTQISGSQIRDGAIDNSKVASDALIAFTKIDFTGATNTLIGAENPLTFNTPLSRTSNAISLTLVDIAHGGLGMTSLLTGRIPFGGSGPTVAATSSANLMFDGTTLSTSSFTVTGTTATFNGKTYTMPSAFGAAGALLTDAAGTGILAWVVPTPVSGYVTLQSSDPGTPDTGGLNITANGYVGGSFKSSTLSAPTVTATILSQPAGPTVTPVGAGGSSQWIYQIVAKASDGSYSLNGYTGNTVVGNATIDGTNYNTVTWTAVPYAVSYDVYRPTGTGISPATTGLIAASVVGLTINDTGLVGDNSNPPTVTNTGQVNALYFTTFLGGAMGTAATISPSTSLFHVTDAVTPIAIITLPFPGFVGSITLIPDAAFTTITGERKSNNSNRSN